jgi:hypothetical protein
MDARGSRPADRLPSQNPAKRRQAKYEHNHENGHSNWSKRDPLRWRPARIRSIAARLAMIT